MFQAYCKASLHNMRIVTADRRDFQYVDLTVEGEETSAGQERVATSAILLDSSFCYICYS